MDVPKIEAEVAGVVEVALAAVVTLVTVGGLAKLNCCCVVEEGCNELPPKIELDAGGDVVPKVLDAPKRLELDVVVFDVEGVKLKRFDGADDVMLAAGGVFKIGIVVRDVGV